MDTLRILLLASGGSRMKRLINLMLLAPALALALLAGLMVASARIVRANYEITVNDGGQ